MITMTFTAMCNSNLAGVIAPAVVERPHVSDDDWGLHAACYFLS